jgi:hypothetical protein
MKVILDINDDHKVFFMELLQSLDYVKVLKEINHEEKSQAIQDLIEALNDVNLHEQGKKTLTSGQDLIDEL